jgi:hypothetical protein
VIFNENSIREFRYSQHENKMTETERERERERERENVRRW